MNRDVQGHLEVARQMLHAARLLLSEKCYPDSVNRSYYTIFKAATALVLAESVRVKTHEGLKIKFAELFVKTGRIDTRFSHALTEAYDLREDADYTLEARSAITQTIAEEQLRIATEFLAMAEEFLTSGGQS